MTEEKEPKDLGVKIGTKAEAMWTRVKKQSKGEIELLEESLIIQKEILKLAEHKILLEERK